MIPITVESVEKEVHQYVLKTYFFSVFNKALSDRGVKVHVERKYIQNNGNPCYPDFYCVNGDARNRVIYEHKGSVSSKEQHILKEIADTERYLYLKPSVAVENVVLVVPQEEGKKLAKVAKKTQSRLTFWSFNFNVDKKTLSFESLHNDLRTENHSVLTSEQIVFPFAWCSLRRFLRDEPPVVYTAGILWNIVLRSLFDHGLSFKEPYEVEFSDVVDVARRFYPGGPDAAEITAGRVRKALSFLNEIDWVTYPNAANAITVHRKRIREELVSKVLCEEYCKIETGVQTSIEDFED